MLGKHKQANTDAGLVKIFSRIDKGLVQKWPLFEYLVLCDTSSNMSLPGSVGNQHEHMLTL